MKDRKARKKKRRHGERSADISGANQAQMNYNAGSSLLREGRISEAVRHLLKCLEIDPAFQPGLNNMGNAMISDRRPDEAMKYFQRAAMAAPKAIEPLINIAGIHYIRGRKEEALKTYLTAERITPLTGFSALRAGDTLLETGKPDQAIGYFRAAAQHPQHAAEAFYKIGCCYNEMDEPEKALPELDRSLSLNPRIPNVHFQKGVACFKGTRYSCAEKAYLQAIRYAPDYKDAYLNLGDALKQAGRFAEAKKAWKRHGLHKHPEHPEIKGVIANMSNYINGYDREKQFRLHRKWARHIEETAGSLPVQPEERKIHGEKRVLNIGYVSPDFKVHSVASFIESIVRHHDRNGFRVFCLSNVNKEDEVTERFRRICDEWLDVRRLSDEELYRLIAGKDIDILVDLAGLTGGNRGVVFAAGAGRIRVSWIGYPNTTGLQAMDYRFTDAVADPPEENGAFHTEQLVRLPHGFLCFRPDEQCPETSPPPVLKNGYITFGSFNNTMKISPPAMELWAGILAVVPDSRILLKFFSLKDEDIREHILQKFREHGISTGRVMLEEGRKSRTEHLNLYNSVDIALDTFPYNGTTTTCEALWMGVPVITLKGDRHASRVGASLLTRVGLDDLIAEDGDEYVRIASSLASDTERFSRIRAGLRGRMSASPLCNPVLITRSVENAYLGMWREYLKKNRELR